MKSLFMVVLLVLVCLYWMREGLEASAQMREGLEASAQTNTFNAVMLKQQVDPSNAFVARELWCVTSNGCDLKTNWAIGPYYDQVSTNYSPYSIERVRETDNVTNLVQMLAREGEICKVFGHNWRDGRPGEGEGSPMGGYYLDYHPNTIYRTCRMCGKCQSQMCEWKETP